LLLNVLMEGAQQGIAGGACEGCVDLGILASTAPNACRVPIRQRFIRRIASRVWLQHSGGSGGPRQCLRCCGTGPWVRCAGPVAFRPDWLCAGSLFTW